MVKRKEEVADHFSPIKSVVEPPGIVTSTTPGNGLAVNAESKNIKGYYVGRSNTVTGHGPGATPLASTPGSALGVYTNLVTITV